MTKKRIVERTAEDWVVRSRAQGRVLTRHRTQKDAIQAATEDLRADGGRVQVFGVDGSLRKSIQVDGSVLNSDEDSRARRSNRIALWGIAIALITLLVSIPVAIFGSQWGEELTQERVVNRLATLDAGNDLGSIDAAIGAATLTQRMDGAPSWKRTIYIRDDFAVSAITGDDNKIVVLTILVCGRGFDATIETPSGTRLRLGDRPLAEAEQSDGNVDVNDRSLNYVLPFTGTWLSRLLELGASEPASGTNWLHHAVGYSSACGSVPESVALAAPNGFIGRVAEAPPEVREFRANHPPNFYTEIDLAEWNLEIDDLGMGVFDSTDPESDVTHRGVPLAFLGGGQDIPQDWPRD